MIKKISVLFLLAVTLFSCAPSSKIVYFNNTSSNGGNNDTLVSNQNFETRIKSDDELMIIVGSPVQGAAEAFNLPAVSLFDETSGALNARQVLQNYLVDRNGEVLMPILGKIKLAGLTKDEAVSKLRGQLEKYIKDPVINLRILNYKISVLGEVTRPGSHNIGSERITLPEALSLSGDMTIYGNRKNIIVIREIEGVKTYNYVDITSRDVINSPYYYLTQNDVVYVSPNKTRVNSSIIGPNLTVGISAISLVITILVFITR